jgi:hypothetical protein
MPGHAWDYDPPTLWAGDKKELRGKTVLVLSEQGFGDTIHFARYIPMVAALAAKTYIHAHGSQKTLLQGLGAEVVTDKNNLPEADIQTFLMSLPMVFGTTVENTPPPVPFNIAAVKKGPRVGFCWHGGSRPHDPMAHADDLRRSIPYDVFDRILDVLPKEMCVSLQEEHLARYNIETWADTCALVAGLDLVISVDTAICHLAATMGVETWTLLRRGGCWRWMSHGETTSWYPTMKLYRQPRLDDWDSVVDRVASDLAAWKDK